MDVRGKDFFFHLADESEAMTLLSTILDLTIKYYALPFPDPCTDSVNILKKLNSVVQACTSDNDCGFFDTSVAAVAPTSHAFLVTDDCTLVPPLAVGNSKLIQENESKFLDLLGHVQASCGDRIFRSGCIATQGFQLDGRSPACRQGACQLPHGL